MEIIDVYMRLRDGVSSGLQRIRSQMEMTNRQQQRLANNVKNVGNHISGIGKSMLPASTAIVATGAAITRTFVSFDDTITKAGAKAGATAEELQKMRSVAGKLGAEFPISATEAAQAMDNLAASGYDANQIMSMLPSVITSSVASGEDLASTSAVVSSALNTWNLQTGDIEKNTTRVADVIQQANNMSALGLQDFGLAMQYAGAPAAALKINIEDLSAAMAIMRNKGIAASSIGTSLRSLFSRLADPPKEAAAAIAQMGIQVEDADGKFIGMENVIGQLRTSMQGMTDVQRIAAAQAIAGTEGYSGLLALIDSTPEAYHRMTEAMYNSAGSSAQQYQIMKQSLQGSFNDMMGSVESLAISFGDVLKPTMKSVADDFAKLADTLNSLTPAQKKLIADIGLGIVAFTGLTLVGGKVITVGGDIISTWAAVNKVLAGGHISNKALEYGVLGIEAGAKKAAAAFRFMKAEAIAAAASAKGVTFRQVGASVASGAGAVAGGMKNAAVNAMGMLGNISLKGIGKGMTSGIGTALRGAAGGVRALAMAGRFLIASPLGLALTAIAGAALLIYNNWDSFGPYFIGLWNNISGAIQAAWSLIGPAIGRLISTVMNFFSQTSTGSNGLGKLIQAFMTLAQIISVPLVMAFTTIGGIVSGVLSGMIQAMGAGIAMMINILTGIITFVVDVFAGDWEGAWNAVVDIFSSVLSGLGGILDGIISGLKGALNSIIDGINSVSVTIPDWVPGVGGSTFGPLGIPHLYTGTEDWGGGPAMIHDRGAEIVDLPNHTRVIPHDRSIETAYDMGRSAGWKAANIQLSTTNVITPEPAVNPMVMVAAPEIPEMATQKVLIAEPKAVQPVQRVIKQDDAKPVQSQIVVMRQRHETIKDNSKSEERDISVVIQHAVIGNVTQAKDLVKKVAEELEFELRKRSINRKVGAV